MELELKHIAPYLPYRLKIRYMHPKEEFQKDGEFKGIEIGSGFHEDIKISIDFSDGEHIWMYKPILRPLSDLFKQIKTSHGGIFTPIEYLEKKHNIDYFVDTNHLEYINRYRGDLEHRIQFLPHGLVEKLCEWHFDVFNLIENGLAIDINTL